MRINTGMEGWLDTLINVGGSIANTVLRPGTVTAQYPGYTPPMFPSNQYPATQQYTAPGTGAQNTMLIGAAVLLGAYLLLNRRR